MIDSQSWPGVYRRWLETCLLPMRGDVDGEGHFVGAGREAKAAVAGLIADVHFEVLLASGGFAGNSQRQVKCDGVRVDARLLAGGGIHERFGFGRLNFAGENQRLAVGHSDLRRDYGRIRRLREGVDVPASVNIARESDSDFLAGLQSMGGGRKRGSPMNGHGRRLLSAGTDTRGCGQS
jgi:hypothetical protein